MVSPIIDVGPKVPISRKKKHPTHYSNTKNTCGGHEKHEATMLSYHPDSGGSKHSATSEAAGSPWRRTSTTSCKCTSPRRIRTSIFTDLTTTVRLKCLFMHQRCSRCTSSLTRYSHLMSTIEPAIRSLSYETQNIPPLCDHQEYMRRRTAKIRSYGALLPPG